MPDMISIFLNLLRLALWPKMRISWRMFHMHLRRKCILLSVIMGLLVYVLSWMPLWVPWQWKMEYKWIALTIKFIKLICVGLPWWCSGWESACQCRGQGFEPWSGKIPHAPEQLGPWATIAEPARLEPVLRNRRGRDSERPAHRDEEWPPLATVRESPCTETKTQHSHK